MPGTMEFVAPKDPQNRREGFYVLLDQPVGGIPQDDGTSRHPIYLSDARLVTFARMVGSVTDEELLKLHYHTDEPWKVLEYAASLGDIHDVVIENMRRQEAGLKG